MPLTPDEIERIRAAKAEAFELGYRLAVDEAYNIEPLTHMAVAFVVLNQPVFGRFLAYGPSAAEAAEAGLDVLRGIVERGEAWPNDETEDEQAEYVAIPWATEEVDAAGESILEALREHNPQDKDELAANTGRDPGLLRFAGDRTEGVKVVLEEAGGAMYWLNE